MPHAWPTSIPAVHPRPGWSVRTALRLAGAAWFDGLAADGRTLQPVTVLLPHTARIRSPGVVVTRTCQVLPETVERCGIACAPAELALVHEMRRATSARRAGAAVDMALAARAVDLDRLRKAASTQPRLPAAVSYALGRACAECRSPKESEMLQVWEADLGFPRPLMNREVLDLSGRVIAVVDLVEEQSGTYGEYNGGAHRTPARQRRALPLVGVMGNDPRVEGRGAAH